ncbi:phage tail protein [Streptomyces alfalfae]|uniref:phage tail protein n=1 Tax=Streptomyces alfalfae TaxID=1642299 RepID=UPI00281283B4|nr:hypothetical protein [Streptomyces alfalfae]
MALHLGELVGLIRADDSGWVAGLNAAGLRLRGLQRDADGMLRDLRGRFVSEGEAAGRGLGDGIRAHADLAANAARRVGPAIAGVGVGLPVVAAATTAMAGLAAGAAAAGLAYKAFSLAVGPQMEAVTEVAKLAEEAQKAAAEGSADAAEKQKAYTDALGQLPPATQAAARSFIGLKNDYQSWSDEMSATTMPLFTQGLEILRSLLPSLTPFVQAAAGAIGRFLDEVAVGVKSAGFKQWAADMASAAGPALYNFLTIIKNLAIGFAGLLQAFLPVSDGMTGGLVRMSAAFAQWGTSLQGSEGFAEFLELAREGGTTLGQLALAVGNLLVALGPLIGVTTQVALALARIINALPPPVLTMLATTIASVVIGMKAWAAGASVVATANTLMASSSLAAIRGWARMMAVGVAAYVRIAASAVASAATTAAAWAGAALRSMATFAAQMIRTAAVAVAQFVMMAARAVAWAAVMAAQWLIAMGPIGWITMAIIALVALVIAKWDTVKAWTVAAWTAVVGAVQGAVQMILAGIQWLAQLPGMVAAWFNDMKLRAIVKALELAVWISTLPGRIRSALAGLLGVLRNAAVNAFTAFRNAAVTRAASFISWVRGLPGRIAAGIGSLAGLLVGKGKDVVRGLWNGIKSMGGWLRSTLISWAKSIVPGPIAKALNIGSPSRLMADEIGRWIPPGIAMGAEANAGVLDKTMANLVSTPTPSAVMGATAAGGGAPGSSAGSTQTHRVTFGDSELDEWFVGRLRQVIGARGGNVQFVLGKG